MPVEPQIAEFISRLPLEYVECRTLGHSWRADTVQWVTDEKAYHRSLVCDRCALVRWQWISQSGHLLSVGGYQYPEGYLNRTGGRIDGDGRDALRLEGVTRMLGTPVGVSKPRRS